MDATGPMSLLRSALLVSHLVCGLAALALFWVPALAKKGGRWHRGAGRWYVRAMAVVTVTGVGLAGLFLADGRWQQGLFLMFLGVITGTSLWNGWRVLRAKRETALYTGGAAHRAVALLNMVGGTALIAYGLIHGLPLLYAFGPVGLLIGGAMAAGALMRTTDTHYWLREHLTGMIGSGIASHVAFMVFGGRQLFGWNDSGNGIVLWVAPLVVGTLAIVILNIRYRRSANERPLASGATA